MAVRVLAGGGSWFCSVLSAANGGAGEDWVKAKLVTEGEAGHAESLKAEGCTAPARCVPQGPRAASSEGRALPYLVDCALPSDQAEQVEVNALQVPVAAPAFPSDCGGFA